MGEQGFHLHVCQKISDIGQADWDRCLGETLSERKHVPFLSYAFLSSLEDSGCASEETGWMPHHLALRDESGETFACMPLYLKSHSQGEYVFDYAWADAFERTGGHYYPKLQSSIPFTPVNAPKCLIRNTIDRQSALAAFASGIRQLCERYHLSSAHLTFLPQAEKSLLDDQGFLMRQDRQFHWINEDYEHFDEFLASLSSRKRKNIKKERKTAQSHGLSFATKRGSDISQSDWDAFFAFYMETGSRKWGRPYLTRPFFSMLAERMGDDLLLFLALEGDRPVAGALNFIGGDTLYGRYWGALDHYPCLHFELCYHQAIDWAIEHNLACVEAGAQGEHKIARGYVPQTTWSCHWISHPAFRDVIADYLKDERNHAQAELDFLTDMTPFKKG
ncbi:MAG: GNAT family N-acetyltransferase [Cohaesibacter sp.]|jgi:predicted N-acyltransferase|nr:GNAT family N-acetyltransferase [Cohaesibacter sp.]